MKGNNNEEPRGDESPKDFNDIQEYDCSMSNYARMIPEGDIQIKDV